MNSLLNILNKFITPYQLNFLDISSAIGMGLNYLGSRKASKQAAAGAASDRAQQQLSLEEQKRQYDIGQKNLAPYMESGRRGLETYESMLNADALPKWGGFGLDQMQEDPGYQFRLQQGYQGLDRMSARGGERFSGKRGIGLMDYGQRMASQEFGAARGRAFQDYQTRRGEGVFRLGQYGGLAQMGQQAAGTSSNLGANYAGAVTGINRNIGSTYTAQADARAAGTLGMTGAITSGLAAYNYGQGFNQPGYGSGIDFSSSGMGMSQSQMLAEQNAGF